MKKVISNKTLLHFVFDQMEQLDQGKTDTATAKTQALLARQANNALKHEIDRVNTLINADEYNRANGTNISLRNIEGSK